MAPVYVIHVVKHSFGGIRESFVMPMRLWLIQRASHHVNKRLLPIDERWGAASPSASAAVRQSVRQQTFFCTLMTFTTSKANIFAA
jgi:hypothetical protein